MEDPDKNQQHQLPPGKVAAIVVVAILMVTLGTLFTLRFQGPRPRGKPTALGHQLEYLPRPTSETNGMVWMAPGTFDMGAEDGRPDEVPRHEVKLDGFWLDETEVTNAKFAEFVRATRYVTVAERTPDTKNPMPGFTNRVAGSLVFKSGKGEWEFVAGANWRHPEGPNSSIDGRERHPVVHVALEDALAFAQWSGKRLPSEAEWEYAARGPSALTAKESTTLAPATNGTAAVRSAPVNTFGLYELSGNVREWCLDWYRADYYAQSVASNPHGPATSVDPEDPEIPKKVVRGGSFATVARGGKPARISTRDKWFPGVGASDLGFRCAR